jgi:hypothetical protein
MTSVMVGQKVQPGGLCDWEGEAPAEPQLRENLAPAHAARQEPRPPELADSQSGQPCDITTSKSRVASGLVKPRDRILEKSRFPCGQQGEPSVACPDHPEGRGKRQPIRYGSTQLAKSHALSQSLQGVPPEPQTALPSLASAAGVAGAEEPWRKGGWGVAGLA